MTEDRNEMLSFFQIATGIDSIETAFNTLEQMNWDLNKAIAAFSPEVVSHESQITPPPLPPDQLNGATNHSLAYSFTATPQLVGYNTFQSTSSTSSSSFPSSRAAQSAAANNLLGNSYQIQLKVTYENQVATFNFFSHKWIGDISKEICVKFNIPSTHLHLDGWPSIVNDEMSLGDVSIEPVQYFNLKASRIAPILKKRQVFINLFAPNGRHEVSLDYDKTISDIKQEAYRLCSIRIKDQKWVGLPKYSTDQSKLETAGFLIPSHDLIVSKIEIHSGSNLSEPQTSISDINAVDTNSTDSAAMPNNDNSNKLLISKVTTQTSEDNINQDYSTGEDSDNNDLGDELICDPDYEPMSEDENELSSETRDHFKEPLIPETCLDQAQALMSFTENFELRYGPIHPDFFIGSMKDVIQASTRGALKDRKPLAVYLHHNASITSNIFCTQILCSETISNFLSMHFYIWAWDMTLPTNTTCFLDNVYINFGEQIRDQLRILGPDNYPLLILFKYDRHTSLELQATITGNSDHEETFSQLMKVYEMHENSMEELLNAEKLRDDREMIKKEQEIAYLASSQADEQRVREREHAELLHIKKEEAKLMFKALEAEERSAAKKRVPEEPAVGTKNITTIRFRFPSGDTVTRRFMEADHLDALISFVHSKGFPPKSHRLIMNYPKKDVTDLNAQLTLKVASLCPQAMIFVEETIES